MKTVNLRPHLKRNILIAAVLLLVCAAAFLNWSYNQRWGDGNSAMADAEDEMTTAVNAADGAPEETVSAALPASVSGYFSEARLTRQQARDSALSLLQAASGAAEVDEAAAAEAAQSIQTLSLLETAACAESASQDVIDSAMNEITVMANWSLLESKIENELLAKDFADCVVYLSSQGCTVAVPSGADGLTETQVAQITDAVLSNTEMTAAAINVIEVRN